MAIYPESPYPTFPYVIEPEWRTIVTEFDSGEEQRRKKWTYSHYNIRLSYYGLLSSAVGNLYEFYQARQGAYEAFSFFDPLGASTHKGLYVGTGDGATTAFDLPGRQIASRTVYRNGTTIATTVSTAAGTDGVDSLRFSTPPTSTQVLTCDIVGTLRVRCRFAEDRLSKSYFEQSLFSAGIELKGLAPA
jgi:uncharacterized protein (TIGR02217 family)